ncbi:MAG: protein translocase subunit SecF, partial [Chloroflexota bacterium]
MLNIVGRRYWYFGLSLLIIIPGCISLAINGLRLGTDFTGGTEITFIVPQNNANNAINSVLSKVVSNVAFIQPEISNNCPPQCTYLVRTNFVTPKQYQTIKSLSHKQWKTGGAVSQTTVSGTIASQLTKQAIIAVAVAALAVLLYISFAFRNAPNPFRFGVAAVVAMLHDVLVILGIFSILGAVANVEIDST